MEPKEYDLHEKQIYARIQRFYDILLEHRNDIDRGLTREDMKVETELDILITEFSKIFGDIIYIQ